MPVSIRIIHAAAAMMIAPIISAQPLSPIHVKHIAAPPSDMASGLLSLPDPASIKVTSRSSLIPVRVKQTGGHWEWSMPIVVNPQGARIALLPADRGAWSANLISPDRGVVAVHRDAAVDPRVRIGTDALPWIDQDRAFTHMSIQPNNHGTWTLSIIADHQAPGFVLFDTGSGVSLSTHIATQSTLVRQPITFVTELSNNARINLLTAQITSPSGIVSTEIAQPGSAQITIFPEEEGPHSVRIIAQGQEQQGNQFLLTTQHVVHAAKPAPLLRTPIALIKDNHIIFEFESEATSRRTILAAEVWGRKEGRLTPVAWISNIVGGMRTLTLDSRWISRSGVDPLTLELQAVRLHDIDSFVPLEILGRVPIPVEGLIPTGPTPSITPDMLTGRPDRAVLAPLAPQSVQSAGPGHRLMLVHGYCTDSNPYPASHFTGDLAEFEDFNQSRSHDEFALLLLAQSAPMKSFGVVAHSQGGIASLHLLNFYWSGLDWARGGSRLIQSVGSPYQGTALAGNAAVLGDIFGFGCGENENLTYTGSANWLSLIPTAARQQVYYHTTSFDDGFGFDYCNLITDLLLDDPDDGVTERSAGQLPGAHNMGHLEGWCHTADMRDPSQCTDLSRNTIMNQEAKR